MKALVLILVLGSYLNFGVLGSKYSRTVNDPKKDTRDDAGVEFSIAKLNKVWEKAIRLQLAPVKQAELHSDLEVQEKDELHWKKLKAEGMDEEGEKEAKLRRNFNVILARYGLDGKKDTRNLESNFLKDHDNTDTNMFEDPRLDKLWSKAKTSGKFSEEELQNLNREFQHHKDKVQEYNIVMETVSRTEDVFQNEISPSEMEIKEHVLHEKHAELKEKLRSINQGFERLRKISHHGFDVDGEFKEPRVAELWDMAKERNFTDDELESFKEELMHFETKVEKHKHYQEQLELSHQKLKHVEALGYEEHMVRNKEKYTKLSEKTREMGYKIRMYCPFCGNTLGNSRSFCGCCGKSVQFLPQSPAEGNAEGETSQDIWNMDTKSELIKKYFSEGHTYEVILDLLKTHHDVHMSLRSLTYRLNQLGLRKRGNYSNLHEVQAVIRSELRGPGQMFGYRTMWQVLKQKYNLTVKRKDIMTLLSEMNPVGSCRRRSRRFVRRVYHSMGPNYIWHVDGYDKLKPYGISVSGCIDGFSRKIMWLKCGPTNNNPAVIALNYMNCVSEHNVVPMRLRTDCGTENGTMSAIHCTLRSTQTDDFSGAASHVYGPSTANQRIESWWSHLRKQRSQFWMELLEDLKDSGHFSGSYEHKCFLRFAFLDVLQMDLDECKLLWNLHRIRPSRMSCCPAGIPNELYALPHRFNSQDCGYPVLQEQLQELETLGQDACPCGDENIQEYLTLIKHENNFQSPQTWESAVNLYLKLKEIADL